ncbi:MAG: ATP-binding protein [Chloroflexota bacterium]|nr:ATP-binding protein [Chloroflexota bacterium]
MPTVLQTLQSLWRRYTEPLITIEDEDKRQHAQLVASIALGVLLMSLVAHTISLFTVWADKPAFAAFLYLAISVNSIPYLQSRRGRVNTAVTILGVLATANIVGAAFQAGIESLYYFITVSIFVAYFASLRTAIILTVLYCLILVVVLPPLLQVESSVMLRGPVPFNLVCTLFTLLFFANWRSRETAKRQALEKSEARYRMISELMTDYAFYYNYHPDGTRELTWITEALETVTGYTPEEFAQLESSDKFFHPDDLERVSTDRQRMVHGERVKTQCRIIRKDGSARWVDIYRVPVMDYSSGRIVGFYGLVNDIHERKQARERLHDAQLRSKQFNLLNRFISALSHDFRNRLSIIESNRYLIGKLVESPVHEQVTRRLVNIQTSLGQIGEQLNNLSTLTSLTTPALKRISFNRTCELAVARFKQRADQAGITLEFVQADALPRLMADETQIEHAVYHLLNNALTYTPVGGQIVVRTLSEPMSVILEVEDTGQGITEDKLHDIFEPFARLDDARTASSGGVGLGLTIVKMIAEMHEGSVEVVSKVGSGSTFRLRLPLEASPQLRSSTLETLKSG